MRAEHGAEQIMRGLHVGDPVAHGFVDGVFERAAAGIDADHFRAQQPHAKHVQALALHVFRAHVDRAGKPEQRGHRRGGDAVLARARFRDHALLAHAHGEQALAEAIVDFVRAGVQQVFALDVDARAAELFGEPRGKLQRRGPAGEIVQQLAELRLKLRIGARFGVGALEFFERRHERFGNVAAAVRAVAARACPVQPVLRNSSPALSVLFPLRA